MQIVRLASIAALLTLTGSAFAAEPVRSIGIYVQPFYESARTPDGKPVVAVGKQYNELLGSSRREDILAARDLIVANPKIVTPMTLMVLAIRFYDVGLRDDAVFWFYVAKERFIVMADVLDTKTRLLAQADEAVRSFSTLAGPIINGYAFCDLAKQQEAHAKAVAWVEANPYEVMFMERAPALPGNRADNHKRGLANAKERFAKERAYFDDAKNRDAFYATRKRNEADEKFCWK
ncbi:MAG: cytochrome-c oxidase [Rhizobiales bacterium]|nr:cytochrome-c oxidase [Hyphomicrobiales bacterium]